MSTLPPRKRKKKTKNQYFTQETEDAIVRYNGSSDPEERSEIYRTGIHYGFFKLTENIIHTFKFYYTDTDDIESLKHEIVSVLLEEKIDKFDTSNRAKEYYYYGKILKRWLINYNNKNYKKLKQIGSFSDMDESFDQNLNLDEPSGITLSSFIDEWVIQMYGELDTLFPKESETQIADAVLTIFKTRNDLDIFKKKALYIYIREMTDCETPPLTRVIARLKEEFYKKYQTYYDRGLLSSNYI